MLADTYLQIVIRFVNICMEIGLRFVLPFFDVLKWYYNRYYIFFKNTGEKVAVGVGRITISITIYYYIYNLTISIQKVIQNVLPFLLSEKTVIPFVTRPYIYRITNRITINHVKANQIELV
jgi:hypothetical protein